MQLEALRSPQAPTPQPCVDELPELQPLTDDQILIEFGSTLWSALTAFGRDATFWAEMVEAANHIQSRRDLWAENREANLDRLKLGGLRDQLGKKVVVEGECWIWMGATTEGAPKMRRPGGGRAQAINARSWTVEQRHGVDPTRQRFRPTCGAGVCVHPDHMSWIHREPRVVDGGAV